MLRPALVILIVALAHPAVAADCWFTDSAGDRLTFLENGENEVIRQMADGQTETCLTGHADNGNAMLWCDVESKTQSAMASSGDDSFEAFDTVWTRTCRD